MIKNQFTSWDWIYGKTPVFSMEYKIENKVFTFKVKNARIIEVNSQINGDDNLKKDLIGKKLQEVVN